MKPRFYPYAHVVSGGYYGAAQPIRQTTPGSAQQGALSIVPASPQMMYATGSPQQFVQAPQMGYGTTAGYPGYPIAYPSPATGTVVNPESMAQDPRVVAMQGFPMQQYPYSDISSPVKGYPGVVQGMPISMQQVTMAKSFQSPQLQSQQQDWKTQCRKLKVNSGALCFVWSFCYSSLHHSSRSIRKKSALYSCRRNDPLRRAAQSS